MAGVGRSERSLTWRFVVNVQLAPENVFLYSVPFILYAFSFFFLPEQKTHRNLRKLNIRRKHMNYALPFARKPSEITIR